MATYAGRRLHTMLDNVAHIVAIELLAAAQGVEFRRPEKSSPILENIISALREISPRYDTDRSLSSDIERVATTINEGDYSQYASSVLPSLSE